MPSHDATGRRQTKMTLHLVSIVSVALFLLWPAQLDAYITQNTGCHHNGTWFADKSVVPSMEKCLNCQCNRKTLVCRLKVCPEMPMPPPRGCVVVQKKNTCCPYLSCARLDAFYKIPTKRRIIAYLDHYERESIDRVVNDNMLQRRSDDSDVDLFVCVKNGTVYKSGSAMSSSNLCSYCYCIGGTEKCVKPKCMLPVDGCKPIFVDSTCCPVRYDCSSKTSGKSSQEVRYRKNSNKHFQRMSQRLQRNRGCTVNSQFYAEGQKMRSDADRPCDICFCIRGTRRCAPKKCAPALKNCIPVVPKGQCCPSSYDCGSQRDYRRSQNSRQFNLYNLLFGKEDQEVDATATGALLPQNKMAERYPLDRHPTEVPIKGDALQASSEKSILDTLREGLEFIDGNNNQMLKDNLDLVGVKTTSEEPLSSTETLKEESTTLSFLDLLLGPSTEGGEKNTQPESTTAKNSLSWVDLLLGPDEEDTGRPNESSTELMTSSSTSSIKRIADDFDEHLESGEIAVGELPAEAQQIVQNQEMSWTRPSLDISTTLKPEPNLLNVFLDGLSDMLEDPANGSTTTTTTSTTTTEKPSTVSPPAPPMFRPLPGNKTTHTRINSKIANLTVSPPMLVVTSRIEPNKSNSSPIPSTTTTTTKKPSTTTRKPSTTTTTTAKSTTSKPKPKTTRQTTTTPRPTTISTAPPTTTTAKTTMRTTLKPRPKPKPTHLPSTTSKPLIIKTNPSILESEPLDDNDGPTLPPSLPNLKIIPFLPTDAVDSTAKLPTQQNFYAQRTNPQIVSDKMDIDVVKQVALYPAIDQATYKYKFNVEVPAVETAQEPVVHVGVGHVDNVGQYEGSAEFVKYDFEQPVVGPPNHSGGFSPPTETEGGFMPKEPLMIDGEVLQEHVTSNVLPVLADNYHVTQHIIDITTAGADVANDTASIEITTPDPFKDVIHTERPPNLDTLIEDKQIHTTESFTYSVSNTTSTSVSSSSATITPTTTTTTKQTPLIVKNEINKLDKLLDELLGMQLSSNASTVPPFKTLPAKSTTPAAATSIPTTKTTTTTIRPTTRATKKGNSKTKPKTGGGNSNRRNPVPSRNKGRTPVNKTKSATTTTTTTTAKPTTTTTTTTAPTTRTSTGTMSTTSSTVHPFLMSPFDKLPFMDASYEVRTQMLQPQQQVEVEQQPQQFHQYQHSDSLRAGDATSVAPSTATASMVGDSLMDPTGQLKLAGCNIYGRMYRVGRIIIELSSQCLECKCTEVGVKCGPLDC